MALSVFRLPDLGEGLTEADVVEWYVAEGEAVALDQPVVALESAKAVVDVPSPVAGRVRRHCARPGETVATGAPLVEFEVEGGGHAGAADIAADAVDAAGIGASGGSGKPPAPVRPSDGSPASAGTDGHLSFVRPDEGSTPVGSNQRAAPADSDGRSPPTGSGVGSTRAGSDSPLPLMGPAGHSAPAGPEERPALPGTERIDAMPAARAKARALGVDLASVAGTGPGGRIRVADVERTALRGQAPGQAGRAGERTGRSAEQAGRPAEPAERAAEQAGRPVEPAGRAAGQAGRGAGQAEPAAEPAGSTTEEEALRGVRKTMAERMALSRARVVPVTVTEDADVGDWPIGEDVTVRLIRAVVAGCGAAPALNAWLDDGAGRRTLHRDVHLGIAADTGDGLFVPVLRDAGAREPAALRAEVDRLRAGAVARSLAPEELDGATVTLSNFGMLAGRYGTPVVVPPQVAILGAGRAREEPAARGGKVVVRRRLPLSLTFDHRVCTGAEASRFLAAAVADLERSR